MRSALWSLVLAAGALGLGLATPELARAEQHVGPMLPQGDTVLVAHHCHGGWHGPGFYRGYYPGFYRGYYPPPFYYRPYYGGWYYPYYYRGYWGWPYPGYYYGPGYYYYRW